jgi:ComF family protein
MPMSKFFSKSWDWLFPPRCCLCAKVLSSAHTLCRECRGTLPWNIRCCRRCALPIESGEQCGGCLVDPPAFTRCVSPFLYEAPVSTLIIQLKFQQQLRYARILSQLIIEALEEKPLDLPDCLLPVPLHYRRLRQRGFNQAVEIAKPISRRFKIPLIYDQCYRRKNTLPQSRLSARARRRNLAGAFAFRDRLPFNHVAVIDDVVTTGQTVRTLSQMLHSQGVKKIEVWCCARAV